MKYLLSLALFAGVIGCTKANPDAVGGGSVDMAAGTGGGGGVGGGGGGGGGTMPGGDMAMGGGGDMSKGGPPDMTSFEGVLCGAKVCSGATPDCCINNSGRQCIDNNQSCTGGSMPARFECDGPEDCKDPVNDVCCLWFGQNGNGSSCGPGIACQQGAQTCHTVSDCPQGQGYLGCCAIPSTQYRRCSKTPCM